VDDASVYWSQGGTNGVNFGPKLPEAGPPTTVDTSNPVSFIYLDQGYIYLSEAADAGMVGRYPKGGGTLVTLAADQQWAGAICADDAAIYWVEGGTNTGTAGNPMFNMGDGRIMKLAK